MNPPKPLSRRPKVSVIIPVYNAQDYLKQCMDSIIGQTIRDIEIICIDDQSTDNSLEILQQYAIRDSRIKVIKQEKSGAGAARNKGLKFASGEYLSFLDADDFFEPNMLEKAYSAGVQNMSDIVVFRSDIYDNVKKKFIPNFSTIRTDLIPKKKSFCFKDLKNDIFRVFIGWAWDKLFLRDFVISHQLYFQEQRTTNDLFFVFSALVKSKNITILDDVLAHHRSNVSSLSTSREESWLCFYHALLALKDFLIANNVYKDVEQSFINYALHFSLWNLNTMNGSAYKNLYQKLRLEIFHELGIDRYDSSYFWHKSEYNQYLKIMNNNIIVDDNRQTHSICKKIISPFASIRNNGIKYVMYKVKYHILKK